MWPPLSEIVYFINSKRLGNLEVPGLDSDECISERIRQSEAITFCVHLEIKQILLQALKTNENLNQHHYRLVVHMTQLITSGITE